MKLDPDCIRAVLLELEPVPYGEDAYVERIAENLEKYSENEVMYTCIKLNEAGFIKAVVRNILLMDMTELSKFVILPMPDISFSKRFAVPNHGKL